MARCNYDLVKRYKEGEYRNQSARFEAETKKMMNQILERIQQFDGQSVPDVLWSAHHKIGRAHGLCYESILFLCEANGSQGAERLRLIGESERKMKEAWSMVDIGTKEFYRTWGSGPGVRPLQADPL